MKQYQNTRYRRKLSSEQELINENTIWKILFLILENILLKMTKY